MRVLLVIAMLGAFACGPTCPPGAPASPQCSVDAGPAPVPATCATACVHLRELGCDLGEPTPRGATCERVCAEVQAHNAGAGFDPRCLAHVSTCADADECR